jgi:hypothetical protein
MCHLPNLETHHWAEQSSTFTKGPGLRHEGLKEAELAPAVGDVRHEETQ